MAKGYQVWSSTWSSGLKRLKRIPDKLLFQGKVFSTKAAAESAWYDTMPGVNDHYVILSAKKQANPSASQIGQWIKAKAIRVRTVGRRKVIDILTTGDRVLHNPTQDKELTFKDLDINQAFRFTSATGGFLGQNTFRKIGSRAYIPVDPDKAKAQLRYMYSGYPAILKKLTGAKLTKAITLRVGSAKAKVVLD